VVAWRAERQQLAARARPGTLLDVVSRVCGLHAQVMGSAELTAWTRVEGLAKGAVAAALWKDRTLVKTWAQRGTLHLLPASELALWVAAQSEVRPRYEQPAWLRHHGLTREGAEAMLEAIARALAGGEWLTRRELAERVAGATGVEALAEKLRGGFGDLLKPAAFRGDLCFAPSAGPEVRFTSPAAWLGRPVALPPGPDAVREVARRYLAVYGPAPREQLARWFGLRSPAQAGRWIASLGDDVVETDLGWMLAADVEAAAAAEPSGVVRLLPAFDHYVVAAPRDEPAVLAAEHRGAVYRPQGWLSPVVLVDGVMAGVWRHELRGGRLVVDVEPFGDLPRAGVEAEAAALASFLGAADVELGA
jgi:hypothetical protein